MDGGFQDKLGMESCLPPGRRTASRLRDPGVLLIVFSLLFVFCLVAFSLVYPEMAGAASPAGGRLADRRQVESVRRLYGLAANDRVLVAEQSNSLLAYGWGVAPVTDEPQPVSMAEFCILLCAFSMLLSIAVLWLLLRARMTRRCRRPGPVQFFERDSARKNAVSTPLNGCRAEGE